MKDLCGNSWTAARGARCRAPSNHNTRRRVYGFVCHLETAERNPASVQKACRGFAKPKGSKVTKPAQNHEIDLFRWFIQQLLNRNKMLMYLSGLGFNTSQVTLKSSSQLCQRLEVVLVLLHRWRTGWEMNKAQQCWQSRTFADFKLPEFRAVCHTALPPHCLSCCWSMAKNPQEWNSKRKA